jgi:hypothetical protein
MAVGGISRPRAFAALRLITKSNLVGCSTGSSAGVVPLRMRPSPTTRRHPCRAARPVPPRSRLSRCP